MKKRFLLSSIFYTFLYMYVCGQDIEIQNTVYPMVFVEGSNFDVDSRRYYLPDFSIGQTEVTLGLWHAVTGEPKPDWYSGDDFPVSGITLEDVDAFIAKLNKLTGRQYRLPTGIEWQYAFQGGKIFKPATYSGHNIADSAGWYFDNSGGNIQPVATKRPNSLGVYDMSGNVSELCSDGFVMDSLLLWFALGGDCFQTIEEFSQTNAGISSGNFDGFATDELVSQPCGLRLVCSVDTLHAEFPASSLTVSENSVSFPLDGASTQILVSTDALSWTVSHLPEWCKAARSEGGLLLNIDCASNSGTSRKGWFKISAGRQEVFININQEGTPATYFRTETQRIAFRSMDTSKTVKVDTDGGNLEVTDLPDWCVATIYEGSFTLTPTHNTGIARHARIKVTALPLETFIDIVQTGSATYLDTDVNKLDFSSFGGTEHVNVSTDGDAWQVSVPWWCRIVRNNTGFTVQCKPNSGGMNTGFIKVSAGGQQVEIMAIQHAPFNSPKHKERALVGISMGYVGKQWKYIKNGGTQKYGIWDEHSSLGGFQFGARFEPLFKYGFGINTGLFFEIYGSNTDLRTAADDETFQYYGTFAEFSMNIPLHIEYRFHIAPHFSLFFYGGASFDLGIAATMDEYTEDEYNKTGEDEVREPYFTDNKLYGDTAYEFYLKRFTPYLDAGAGIRVYGAQINVQISKGLEDISPWSDLIIRQNKNIAITLSWMIGE
ncbi:MAG: SUMF1/EgtB/PvdO family nonheme iron enzyme [Cytophagaceae bacterium]|nr:SUMF1/EgtB/PvdO family nonheme iron enzyme [Cytophagaceae bacterium]